MGADPSVLVAGGRAGLAGFLSVGILPTNLLVFAVLPVWLLLYAIYEQGWRKLREQSLWSKAIVVGLLPLSGLLFLFPVYPQLARSADGGAASSWQDLVVQWPFGALRDFWWLLPLLLLPLFIRNTRRKGLLYLGLFFSALLAPLLCAVALPAPPNSRVFYPVLPLLYLPLAWSICLSGRELLGRRAGLARLSPAALGVFLAGLLLLGGWREFNHAWYFQRYSKDAYIHNLYDHTYQYDFRIPDMIQTLWAQMPSQPGGVVVGSWDALSVAWYLHRVPRPQVLRDLPFTWVGMIRDDAAVLRKFQAYFRQRQIFLVVRDAAEAQTIAGLLAGAEPFRVVSIGDYGVFQLARVDRLK